MVIELKANTTQYVCKYCSSVFIYNYQATACERKGETKINIHTIGYFNRNDWEIGDYLLCESFKGDMVLTPIIDESKPTTSHEIIPVVMIKGKRLSNIALATRSLTLLTIDFLKFIVKEYDTINKIVIADEL